MTRGADSFWRRDALRIAQRMDCAIGFGEGAHGFRVRVDTVSKPKSHYEARPPAF
jgi:hypothetical protein